MDSEFRQSVLNVVRKIPKGRTLSYAEVAERAGHPGAFRAVGSIMSNNYDPSVPCHRVIHSSGAFGRYNRGDAKKIALLQAEGALHNDVALKFKSVLKQKSQKKVSKQVPTK